MYVNRGTFCALLFFSGVLAAQSPGDPVTRAPIQDFDIRSELPPNPGNPARTVSPRNWTAPRTQPRAAAGQSPEITAREFLSAHPELHSLAAPDIGQLRLASQAEFPSGATLVFEQYVSGLRVFGATASVSLDTAGSVLHASSGAMLNISNFNASPRLTPSQSLQTAFRLAGVATPSATSSTRQQGNKTEFANPLDSAFRDIPSELILFPMSDQNAVLAYHLYVEVGPLEWYEIVLDANQGSLLYRHNLYVYEAIARVWKETPLKGPREMVTFPNTWLPATATVTNGNFADVFLDRDANGSPDPLTSGDILGGRAYSPIQFFDFFADPAGLNPTMFQPAAVANLFYFVNAAHDYFYALGFTEPSWNMQNDNRGRGGIDRDAVFVGAQDPSVPDNASFASTPDGMPPRMRVGLFTIIQGTRDAGNSGDIIFHEYAHGVTNRMIGRGRTGCLDGRQSGAMGEGWSDYFSISFYNNPVTGGYLTGDTVRGIRRQGYEGHTLTFADIGNDGFQVHNDGEIWAALLWDVRKSLGAEVTDKLVFEGLRFTPCNPSMVDARDGILQADEALNKSANRAKLWELFAKHGLGHSAGATDGSQLLGTYFIAASDLPPDLQPNARRISVRSRPPTTVLDTGFTYQIEATGPTGAALRYELNSGPAGLIVDPATGLVRWPAPLPVNSRVKITISDGQGASVVYGFEIPPVELRLDPATPRTLSGATNSIVRGQIAVPSGTQILQVSISGTSGDADLVLFDPDLAVYERFIRFGSTETLSVSLPRAGTWRVLVFGFLRYTNATLRVAFPTPRVLDPTGTVAISGSLTSETFYKVTPPRGATALVVAITGSRGFDDVHLFVRRGRPAVCQVTSVFLFPTCVFDFRSTNAGTANESITITNPGTDDYYITVSAATSYSGETLSTTTRIVPTLVATPATLTFNGASDAPPPTQTIRIVNAEGTAFTWTAEAKTEQGGDWLKLSSNKGDAAANVTVTADPKGLSPGTYRGSIAVAAVDLASSPTTLAVTMIITAPPSRVVFAASNPVVNGASFQPGLAPQSWITLRGTGLSETTREWRDSDFVAGQLPTALDGVRVTVNGKPAAIAYISPTQINALAPADTATGAVTVAVTSPLGTAQTTAVLQRAAPAFFAFAPEGRKYVAAVHADGVYAAKPGLFGEAFVRPLQGGNRALFFANGFGETNPPAPNNAVPQGALPLAKPVIIRIGGVAATVEFAGLVGVGLYQFNIVVPEGLTPGDHPVTAEIDGVRSLDGMFVTIAASQVEQTEAR